MIEKTRLINILHAVKGHVLRRQKSKPDKYILAFLQARIDEVKTSDDIFTARWPVG